MSQSAQSTAELQVSARVNRGDSDASASAATLARNVNKALRWASVAEIRDQGANAVLQRMLTGHQHIVGARVIEPAPATVRSAQGASFRALQEWEGYVVDVDETDFVARLLDVTAGAVHEEEEAVIPRAELSNDDDARMRVGSIFRWVIGYERSPAGTKKRVSQIVFRDLPAITPNDLREGEDWAQEMAQSLNP